MQFAALLCCHQCLLVCATLSALDFGKQNDDDDDDDDDDDFKPINCHFQHFKGSLLLITSRDSCKQRYSKCPDLYFHTYI